MLLFKPKTKYIYKLNIHDMRCGECELHIQNLIRKAATVKKVVANRFKKEVIIYTNESLNINQIKAEIEKTGYKVLKTEIEVH